MAKKKRGRSVVGPVVIILLLIAAAVAVWIGSRGNDSPPPAPPPTTQPELPPEPALPGEPFEASGTLLALPGAPSLPINLWDHPDRSSGVVHVVGQLPPRQTVTITRRFRHVEEDQFYYRVEAGELVGWVAETLVDVRQ